MKKKLLFLICSLFVVCAFILPTKRVNAYSDKIYLGGMPAGFSLEVRGANVVGLTDVITSEGLKSPAKEAGIVVGDVILSINGNEVNNANDIAFNIRDGVKKILEVKRGEDLLNITVTPARDLTRHYKLGVFIRDNVNGIGTISFFKGNTFASLGHPVIDENGNILQAVGGQLYKSDINGYKKGERGAPGELHGMIIRTDKLGNITKNQINGVYGTIDEGAVDFSKLIEIEKGVAEMGKAYIYTTIDGDTPEKYEISIVKIDQNESVKNYVIKINDKRLLSSTGGIVQGMSGSPIVQNGKLVGAVTHVFINDPTRGFGISIENMLNN